MYGKLFIIIISQFRKQREFSQIIGKLKLEIQNSKFEMHCIRLRNIHVCVYVGVYSMCVCVCVYLHRQIRILEFHRAIDMEMKSKSYSAQVGTYNV